MQADVMGQQVTGQADSIPGPSLASAPVLGDPSLGARGMGLPRPREQTLWTDLRVRL